ncbi:hypothetical protein BKP45_13590 [Anaerobacillus alkalidiazotrophicus]|uniref:ABC3 transporter permease C-terminal domain-containing protein n=1 Tax=Anaerobacillus alkalidiazotrophicus TaxID=472963 RepID=A0A1S2M3A7_9BACI|nr:FtsX-like permease family protein [Anaerobacillus alkalidiazotrophicus]OIJ19191.1 hypothetical protein BKP45_13590 [Anaerobacillus alkalidiazotrophicus]
MTYNQFIFKAVLYNFRKYLAYFFCITFSMTVFFLFTAIWFTPNFNEHTSAGTQQIVQIAGVISCVFSIFIITYSYQQFFKSRTKELAILLSYGLLHRDMKKMIIFENSFIFLTSLIVALISGSVFSRLIFMITTSILAIEDIHFSLTFQSFLWTTIAFIPIYALIVGLTLMKMKNNHVTNLLKTNRVKEMNREGNRFFMVIGLVIIITSFTLLTIYTSDFSNVDSMREVILLAVALCIVGVYLFLSQLMSLLYMFFNRKGKLFHQHILPLTEFASKFVQNRTIIFMVCLLSMGTVFFSTLSYTLYHQSYAIADNEQLFDVMMKDYEAVHLAEQMKIDQLLAQEEHIADTHILHVAYLYAPEMDHTPWRTNKHVMAASVEEMNGVLGTNYSVDQGHAIIIDFNQQYETVTYFTDTILIENNQSRYTYVNQGTEQYKLFDRYVFSQPIVILLNEADMKTIVTDASTYELGTIYMFTFDDWLRSGAFVSELKSELDSALEGIADQKREAIETIKERYNQPFIVHSKYDRYHHTKQVSGFALFIMSFISILFVITACIVLYFKTFADAESDRQKLRLLRSVGITSSEIKAYIYTKLKMLIVLPIIFGSLLGLCLSVAINLYNVAEIEVHNGKIFANGLKIISLYFVVIGVYYYWLRMTYRRTVE